MTRAISWLLAGVLLAFAATGWAAPPETPVGDLRALAERVEKLSVRTDEAGQLEFFRTAIAWLDAAGIKTAEPYALKLMYLQGGRADRHALEETLSGVIKPLEEILRRADQTLAQWRNDLRKLATVVPELESLRQQLRYKGAWLGFYLALAQEDGKTRQAQLQSAQAVAQEFAAGDEASGVKHWSILLAGMCARQLGRHQQAADLLAQVATDQTPPAARVQAMFEQTCNLIEWNRFARASHGVVDFREKSLELLGTTAELEIDVKTIMLMMHLCETQADVADDPDTVRRYRQAAQQAATELLRKYAAHQDAKAALVEVLATRYQDRTKPDGLISPILLGVARQRRLAGEADDLAVAERLLRTVLDREDETSRALTPEALWELGMTMNARRMNTEAGRVFVQLAREYSTHRLACDAARNAVYSYSGVVAARRREGEPIATNLRREFVQALELLLAKWGGEEDFARWYFDLGWQYQKLAGQDDYELMVRAAAAYDRVPSGLAESMEARHLSLELKAMLLAGPAATQEDPHELVLWLDQYASAAMAAAGVEADADRAKHLRDWGARAAFRAATVVCDTLGREAAAMQRLRRLIEQCPDAEVSPEVWQFEIDKLLQREQTAQAIERIDAFRGRYPGGAHTLVHLLVRQIRQRIDELTGDPARGEELRSYRGALFRFGKELYEAAVEKNLSREQMYPMEQMWAEALLAGGKTTESLKMFQRCAAYDRQRRGVATDATNLLGLARANRLSGNLAEAADFYRQLAGGIDRGEHASLYWKTQLERCECLRDAAGGDESLREQLRVLIRQLRFDDPRMGGRADAFLAIEKDVQAMSIIAAGSGVKPTTQPADFSAQPTER